MLNEAAVQLRFLMQPLAGWLDAEISQKGCTSG